MSALDGPLAGLRFSLVGPGRVGSSLAHWLVERGAALAAVAGRPAGGGAARLVAELGGEIATLATVGREAVDLLLIAVHDPALCEVAELVAPAARCNAALHTSGAASAAVLAPLAAAGVATGSFHPLKAFTHRAHALVEAEGLVFGIDGSHAAIALAERLAGAFGARAVPIPAELRRLYHLGATLAAGGVVTLLATAGSLARQLGLADAVVEGYCALARGALAAAEPSELCRAITGPVARGDGAAFEAALIDLEARASALVPLVTTLALATLDLLAAEKLDSPAHRELRAALTRRSSSP